MGFLFVDAHEDLAYNVQVYGRDYLRSAVETRAFERSTETPARTGDTLLGLADWRKANTALIFSTLFTVPWHRRSGDWERPAFRTREEFQRLLQEQVDFYQRLADEHPADFRLIRQKAELLDLWEKHAQEPDKQHPIGLVLLLEGAEGIYEPQSIEEWYEMGVRIVGPVWAGNRFKAGGHANSGFDREGQLLLEIMSDLGLGLDLAHMSEKMALEALDRYEGVILASHANARALVGDAHGERHLTDVTIRRLAERGGVMGVMPFNRFIQADWTKSQPRDRVSMNHLVNHIDHICQLTGSAIHAGIGTDFDGGFGFPEVPVELNSIAEIQVLANLLVERGYNQEDIENIMGMNWKRLLERILPG